MTSTTLSDLMANPQLMTGFFVAVLTLLIAVLHMRGINLPILSAILHALAGTQPGVAGGVPVAASGPAAVGTAPLAAATPLAAALSMGDLAVGLLQSHAKRVAVAQAAQATLAQVDAEAKSAQTAAAANAAQHVAMVQAAGAMLPPVGAKAA